MGLDGDMLLLRGQQDIELESQAVNLPAINTTFSSGL